MPMPSSWVDELLGRLSVRYGEAFVRQYTAANIQPEAVRADWAEVLDGVTPESIRYALQYLPEDRPPNALQFRALCRQAPRSEPERAAIGAEWGKPAPRVAEALRALSQQLRANAQRPRQRAAAPAVGNNLPTHSSAGLSEFRPVPDHLLPPGMRNGGIARDFAAELVAKHEAGEWVDSERLAVARRMLHRPLAGQEHMVMEDGR